MDEVASNPATGLPNLLAALNKKCQPLDEQAGTDLVNDVPRIFALLPKAMESVQDRENSKPMLAACSLTKLCVDVYTAQALGANRPAINVEHLEQCQRHLVEWLRKVLENAALFMEDDNNFPCATRPAGCESSSKEAKAFALATLALFKLEISSSACKEVLKKADGIWLVTKALDKDKSGIKREAMKSLVVILNEFVDNAPENVDKIIACNVTYKLTPYLEDPVKYDVSKEMLIQCSALLETCVGSGKDFKNKDAVRMAIDSSRKAVGEALTSGSGFDRQISPLSNTSGNSLERRHGW